MSQTAVGTNQQLAKIIERQNLLPIDVLDGLVARARTLQEWLGQVAADDGLVSFEELALAISREMRMPLASLRTPPAELSVLSLLPAEVCRTYQVIPLNLDGASLAIAVANPLDDSMLAAIHDLVGYDISPMVAPLNAINSAILDWYAAVPAPKSTTRDEGTLVSRILGRVPGTPHFDEETLQGSANDAHNISVDQLLYVMIENRASDLHIAVGSPPMIRVDGELLPMAQFPTLDPSSIQNMLYAILNDVQITEFERHWELDFAYSIPKVSRFRVNVHRQRGTMGAVMRTIPEDMPTLEKLRMPPVVLEMTQRPRGLVLVTGPTGSGKSTTLAAMIDEINRTTRAHIVTIEDPIEFLHKNKMSVVTQREIGADTESFTTALRHVLRQDPDVILIGEMRDLETIAAAVTAAETGHLVFATLHTTSASQTIERIIDVFPPHQQEQIRSQLSNTLEGILTQTLLPNLDGHGRSCAQEILICTPAIRNLIREGKVHQMASVMQASAKYGMQTLDNALKQLVMARKVSLEQAILKASNPEDFKALLAMQ